MNLQASFSNQSDHCRMSIGSCIAIVLLTLVSLPLAQAGNAQPDQGSGVLLHDSRLDAAAALAATRADLDGDGTEDLVLGLPGHDRDRGRVIILYGPDSEWPARIDLAVLPEGIAHELHGELPGDRLGHALLAIPRDNGQRQTTLLIGAPGARNPDGLTGSGTVYAVHETDRLSELSIDRFDGRSGYRLLAGSRQSGLGSHLIALGEGSELPVALSATPWTSLLQSSDPPYQPAYWPGDIKAGPVLPIGQLDGLPRNSHRRRHSDGREFFTLPPVNGGFPTIMRTDAPAGSTGLALELHPSGLVNPGPEINFGDGIADQYVLSGELLTLSFAVSDSFDPPEELNVNASFLTTPGFLDPASLAVSGTGTLRTLTAQTLTGLPDGSDSLEVSVTNTQGLDAIAPFQVFVLNSSIPLINGGLGLADESVNSGDLLTIPFTATDLLFDSESLIYQATSSDQSLLPDSALVLDGDGPDRSLSIQTAAGQSGQTTISVGVTNPLGESVIEEFLLTIVAVGGDPAINGGNGIANQVVLAGDLLNVPFQVSDPIDPPQDLVITAQSDNPALIDNASLTLVGTTQNRALRIQTAAGQTGSAGISIQVTNLGGLTASAAFTVSVVARTPPLINFGQGIPDQTATAGETVEVNLAVSDLVEPPGNLVLTAESLRPEVVSNDAMQLFGTGTSRVLRIDTEPDQTGLVEIRLEVFNSFGLSTQASFNLELTLRDAPLINDGLPLPDQTLPPDRIAVIDFVVRTGDGQPGDFELRVFSTDQEVLPDDAMKLENDGPEWTLEIDTARGRPGTTFIIIEARQPDGEVSQASFELIIDPVPTVLAIDAENLDLKFGDQRLVRLNVANTGADSAFDLLVTLAAIDDLEVTGTWSQASGCAVNDGEVGCEDIGGAAWQCQSDSGNRTCGLNQLPAETSAVLIVALRVGAGGQLEINAEAVNAGIVTASVNPGD